MPLHEMDPTRRFTSRADDYRRYRPDYPAALLDRLLETAPEAIADIGSGTGISSLQMAERGPRVYAVEPNEAMRSAGSQHSRISWVDGTAESTELESGSVDLVTCFQSFHWFVPEPAIIEFLRILRPAGTIAAIWNERDPSDGFTAAYGALIREISNDHPAESRESAVSGLYESSRLADVTLTRFSHGQTLDLEGLIGRAASTSYLPSSGDGYDRMARQLEELFADWNEGGTVTLRYISSLYTTSAR